MTGDQTPPDRWYYAKVTSGGWVVRKDSKAYAYMFRETEELARIARDKANAHDDAERIRDAAPDMLAALVQLEAFGSQELQTRNVKFTMAQKIAALNKARAAIAKATGAA
jgi:hypothetical protein